MKKRKPIKFLAAFSLTVISTLLVAFSIIALPSGVIIHLFPNIMLRYRWISLLWGCLLWGCVGWSISKFFGAKILRPIQKLNQAAGEIAAGNFGVRMEEQTSIQEMQEMAKKFNIMAGALERTELIHSDFTRNVSHEFKTPLSAIKGYAVMLQADSLEHDARLQYAQQIVESANRLTALTDNILLLSKLENQQIELEKRAFNLAEQIRDAALLLEPQWLEKELTLEFDAPEIVLYKGNEELIFQVWQNLIVNAIKFTKANGHIFVKVTEDKQGISVSLQDDGIGMSEEDQVRVFERFYQADQSHSGSGNGLGLALVRKIVELHNGTITVQSKKDCGSVFGVWLKKIHQ